MLERETAEEAQGQLLRRIAEGDRDALGAFYDQTAGVLFSLAIRILRDPHEAEEAIQDVFVQIWEKAALFDLALGTPFHWALGITRHRCIDRLRARQRRASLLENLAETATFASAFSEAETQTFLSSEELAAVRAALEELSPDQKQAIEMAFFGGLSHLEIAAALNEPLGTIKARIRRGMLKLRETLQVYAS